MKKPFTKKISLLVATLALSFTGLSAATTDPVGYVTLTINAGNGSIRQVTPLSMPLLYPTTTAQVDGSSSGAVTGVSATTISDSAASWTPAELSADATPVAIRMTSGASKGRVFLISTSTANTADTITIDSTDLAGGVDLTNLIAVSDTYQLINIDTFLSVFGSPGATGADGIVGGTSPATADNVLRFSGTSWETYYYNTTLGYWTKIAGGNPDESNTPIRPDDGLVITRLDTNSLDLVVTGTVPDADRKVKVNASGITSVGHALPVDTTLGASGIETTPEWVSDVAVANADKVLKFNGTAWETFWHDGTNWIKLAGGSPIADSEPVPSGTVLLISKVSAASSAQSFTQTLPYTL